MDKKPKIRLSDAELELLKATFAGNEKLLLTLRNLFFGLEVSDEEKTQVKQVFSSEALRKLMRKQFLPEFQADIPIGQNIDLYMLVDIKGKTKEQIFQEVKSTNYKKQLIENALSFLENPHSQLVGMLTYPSDDYETYLAGRNQFVNHVDRQLQTIEVLAGQATETIEQTKERLFKDSTK